MAEYYSDDVTWCTRRDCEVTECERHQVHRRKGAMFYKYFSVSDFFGTKFCIKEKRANVNL